jgi:hypothetical protein
MWKIEGTIKSGKLAWKHDHFSSLDENKIIELRFRFCYPLYIRKGQIRTEEAINSIERFLKKMDIAWNTPTDHIWVINLDRLRQDFSDFNLLSWFRGQISIVYQTFEFEGIEGLINTELQRGAGVSFIIAPKSLRRYSMPLEEPLEIQESLLRFKSDYPVSNKVAFVMMQFGETKAHKEIVATIKDTLNSHGITGVRADDKQYHDDLFYNIMTYLYGCGIGIAVFERIEGDEFNPNVSLEVGYMTALKKPICLLKDKTLKTLPTDIIGKLYKIFDPQDSVNTIPQKITQWLSDKRS